MAREWVIANKSAKLITNLVSLRHPIGTSTERIFIPTSLVITLHTCHTIWEHTSILIVVLTSADAIYTLLPSSAKFANISSFNVVPSSMDTISDDIVSTWWTRGSTLWVSAITFQTLASSSMWIVIKLSTMWKWNWFTSNIIVEVADGTFSAELALVIGFTVWDWFESIYREGLALASILIREGVVALQADSWCAYIIVNAPLDALSWGKLGYRKCYE